MARIACFCGHYQLSTENATYVKDGKPLCAAITCERAALRARYPELYREASELRQDTRIEAGDFHVVS